MANVTFVNFPTAMETNQTFASTASIDRINSGQTKTHTITLITIGSIVIPIGFIMWIFRVVVARLGGGVVRRGGVFWMRPVIIAGLRILKRIERNP
jgi:hypothetical protein